MTKILICRNISDFGIEFELEHDDVQHLSSHLFLCRRSRFDDGGGAAGVEENYGTILFNYQVRTRIYPLKMTWEIDWRYYWMSNINLKISVRILTLWIETRELYYNFYFIFLIFSSLVFTVLQCARVGCRSAATWPRIARSHNL